MYYDEYLEKVAAKKKDNAFNMDFGERGNKERKLIEQYKNASLPFEKNMIFNDIKKEYSEIINKCISQSGILYIMDREDAQQAAEIELKHIIDKFDLNYANKPSTYIMGNLSRELGREVYNNQNNTSRRSPDLTMKNGFMVVADQTLRKMYNRAPTIDELHNHITNVMGRVIDKSEIERNLNLNRNILSGDQIIGGNNESNAETLSLMDIKNVSKKTPEQLMDADTKQRKIDSILNDNFTRPERKMLREYYGLGEFKGKAVNLYRAATDVLVSYYEAKKVVDKFEKLLDEEEI